MKIALKILCLSFMISLTSLQIRAQNFFLDENGITVKCTECSEGDVGVVNGVTYQAVDNLFFYSCAVGNCSIPFNYALCTSLVTGFSNPLPETLLDSQDLRSWDVSNVITMNNLFYEAESFNQDIGAWDVSNVIAMDNLFYEAENFNQDIGAWDVSNVVRMNWTFAGASSFNQDLSEWEVSQVEEMNGMFYNASAFNQPLMDWDVSNVVALSHFMNGATNFNQDLNTWSTDSIQWARFTFANSAFNQPLSNWDVSNLIKSNSMFENNTTFNQDLSSWNVSNLEEATAMFKNASDFSHDLSGWCTVSLLEREEFDLNSGILPSQVPVWGTCPDVNDCLTTGTCDPIQCQDPIACNYLEFNTENNDELCVYRQFGERCDRQCLADSISVELFESSSWQKGAYIVWGDEQVDDYYMAFEFSTNENWEPWVADPRYLYNEEQSTLDVHTRTEYGQWVIEDQLPLSLETCVVYIDGDPYMSVYNHLVTIAPDGTFFSDEDDGLVVFGRNSDETTCQSPNACNYDAEEGFPWACDFESCKGCTYQIASNYDPSASQDNGSCIFEQENGNFGDFNDDGSVNTSDLIVFLSVFGVNYLD